MPDGTQKEFLSFEKIEIGVVFNGGTVRDCRKLSRKYV